MGVAENVAEIPQIWIAANTSWYVFNFRARLIESLLRAGYRVSALSPPDRYVERITALGAQHHGIVMDSAGTNPFADGALLLRLTRIIRRERPNLLLTFTPKMNIYGSLAARAAGVPAIANISGLGRGFIHGGWLTFVVKRLYRVALRHPSRVFFQNDEDRRLFELGGLVRADRTASLPGSGVDLSRFKPSTNNTVGRSFVFLLAARLLWDKGLGEFVEAARIVRSFDPSAEFRIVGFLDVDNPTAVSQRQVQDWQAAGLIRYLGSSDDMVSCYAEADCVVLPSYREGMPRCLLEASAMGIPVITTRVAGCRQVVDGSVTGLLCEPRDPFGLAEAMRRMMALDPVTRRRMGEAGRRKMEREFDEKVVIERYLAAIRLAMEQESEAA